MNEVWYSNRPCDRLERVDWLIAVGMGAGSFLPVAAITAWFYVYMGGSLIGIGGAFLGALIAVTGFTPLLIILLMERDMAIEISFRATDFVWRTRTGKTQSVAYTDVDGMFLEPRNVEVPRRFLVMYHTHRFPDLRGLRVSLENGSRLKEQLRGPRKA